ncbi:hypothetical protein Mgra_00006236, partial [Meloidogyne graminicola]
ELLAFFHLIMLRPNGPIFFFNNSDKFIFFFPFAKLYNKYLIAIFNCTPFQNRKIKINRFILIFGCSFKIFFSKI